MNWKELKFWETGEYQVIEEKYADLGASGTMMSPRKKDVFRALKECPYEQTKVLICGQDPYPDPAYATGISFSIPPDISNRNYPPTLVNLLKEYQSDLRYPDPSNGSLLKWCEQGVLLWNVIPSCTAWRSMSHDWPEWEFLNAEIIQKLTEKETVFVFLGGVARRYSHLVPASHACICLSHPSPRGSLNSKTPFIGSRMFSTINTYLKQPVDWRLS